jgi:hypothetical protein
MQARGPAEVKDGRQEVYNRLRRNTVQVCDVHRRLKDVDLQTFQKMAVPLIVRSSSGGALTGNNGHAPGPGPDVERVQPHVDEHQKKLDRLYDAAVVADQNAKLVIFATRPAIYTPVRCLCNIVCKFPA